MSRFRRINPVKVEKRAVDGHSTVYLVGVACPYDKWSRDLGWFKECFKPGAFRNLNTEDVYCLFDHDSSRLLGRVSNGTLKLVDTPTGLNIECALPNTTYARDLTELVERGDIKGMSFQFAPVTDEWGMHEGKQSRTIVEADLYEVSFVTDPAYNDTEVQAESRALMVSHAQPDYRLRLVEIYTKLANMV